MRKSLVILLYLPMIGFGQIILHQWDDVLYDKYDYMKFQDLEIVHQKIDPYNIDYNLLKAAIFYCTNLQRYKYKIIHLKHSPALERAAQKHSMNMVKKNFFSHRNRSRVNKTVKDRLKSEGIKGGCIGENISWNFEKDPSYWSFALAVVEGWMASPGHKSNILDKEFKYLGCGTYYYKDPEWVDLFNAKSTQNLSSNDTPNKIISYK